MRQLLITLMFFSLVHSADSSKPSKSECVNNCKVLYLPADVYYQETNVFSCQKELYVYIDGVDFLGTFYTSNTDCALAKAIKRQMGDRWLSVGADNVAIVGRYGWWSNYAIIGGYGPSDFDYDLKMAKKNKGHLRFVKLVKL